MCCGLCKRNIWPSNRPFFCVIMILVKMIYWSVKDNKKPAFISERSEDDTYNNVIL